MKYFFMRHLLVSIVIIISLCSCDIFFKSKKNPRKYAMVSYSETGETYYEYVYPDKEKELDEELKEISGLDFDITNNSLLANNDEQGNIYELDINHFNIISKNQFWNTGDYEGVEYDGEFIWVLKSNGNLYKYDPIIKETEEFETKLSSNNDVEGLCYDSGKKLLYMACKGTTLNKEDKIRTKAIYVFDVEKKKLKKKPLITIHPKQIKKFIEETAKSNVDENYLERAEVFSPSAIAMNKNKDLFILSARGSVLLVVDMESKIKEITFLNPKYLPQPEGICFDSDYNLYVSTEGKSNKARLVFYKNRNK